MFFVNSNITENIFDIYIYLFYNSFPLLFVHDTIVLLLILYPLFEAIFLFSLSLSLNLLSVSPYLSLLGG